MYKTTMEIEGRGEVHMGMNFSFFSFSFRINSHTRMCSLRIFFSRGTGSGSTYNILILR